MENKMVIKQRENRQYYSPTTHTTVRLSHIEQFVRRGWRVSVINHKGEDITHKTLVRLLSAKYAENMQSLEPEELTARLKALA